MALKSFYIYFNEIVITPKISSEIDLEKNSDLQAGIWFGSVALSPIITFIFYSFLFHFILSYSILFYSIYFILFHFIFFIFFQFYCQSSSLYVILLVVFQLYNELRHTHKREMELSTPDCTSSYFCHLFTDLC